jgi:hypothetical protein
MSGNSSELIISPEELVRIQEACRQRAAKLAATGASQNSPIAPGPAQSACEALPVSQSIPATLTVAERFAAALETMPANVQRFFQHEEPAAFHQPESVENKAERRLRESFGGWCG